MLLRVGKTRQQSGYPTAGWRSQSGHPTAGWTMCSASALKYRSATKKRETFLSAIQWIVLEGTAFNETRNKPGTGRQMPRYVKVVNV